jgi:hypothetical protein
MSEGKKIKGVKESSKGRDVRKRQNEGRQQRKRGTHNEGTNKENKISETKQNYFLSFEQELSNCIFHRCPLSLFG